MEKSFSFRTFFCLLFLWNGCFIVNFINIDWKELFNTFVLLLFPCMNFTTFLFFPLFCFVLGQLCLNRLVVFIRSFHSLFISERVCFFLSPLNNRRHSETFFPISSRSPSFLCYLSFLWYVIYFSGPSPCSFPFYFK